MNFVLKKKSITYLILFWMLPLFLLPQNKGESLTFSCSKKSLRSVLAEFRSMTGMNFIYYDDLVKNEFVTCSIQDENISDVLGKILTGKNLSFKIFDKNSVVLFRKLHKIEKSKPVVVEKSSPFVPVSNTFVNPELIPKEKINYPEEAVRNKIEGTVTLKFYISSEGDVSNVKIISSSGSAILDNDTINYVKGFKFIPAQINGKNHYVWMTMTFQYYFEEN